MAHSATLKSVDFSGNYLELIRTVDRNVIIHKTDAVLWILLNSLNSGMCGYHNIMTDQFKMIS